MRVIIEPDAAGVASCAAGIVAQLVRRKPRCVLGLATGSTPQGTYDETDPHAPGRGLDFSQVVTFNLDEYVGLDPTIRRATGISCSRACSITSTSTRGTRTFPMAWPAISRRFASNYERQIREVGGIDLQILGIGTDGHIAFNEPGSSLGSRTRLKTLASETIRDNARVLWRRGAVYRVWQ